MMTIYYHIFILDHYSNLRNILKNFTVKRIIPNISYDKWEKQFGKDLEKLKIPMADNIKNNYLVDGIVFEDWSYAAKNWMKHLTEIKNAKENNKSNMIFFLYYGKKFLISGDAEKQLGNQIIKAKYIRPVDFYQVADHGSGNALDANLLLKSNQNIVIFQVLLHQIKVIRDTNLLVMLNINFQKKTQLLN